MAKVKSIRSIERAVDVLRFLQQAAPASLEDIHTGTGLARATAARILLTLLGEGMIRRGFADNLYRISARLPALGAEVQARDRLAEAGAPHMVELCHDVGWPSDLMVRRGLYMEVVESTRLLSPFFIQRMQPSEYVTLPPTAVGRAYFAFCPAPELSKIKAELAAVDFSLEKFYGGKKALEREIGLIRQRGYADRHPSQRGLTSMTVANYDDGLSSIAVPLAKGDRIWGCLNLLWNRGAGSVAEMADRYLEKLTATAGNISASLKLE